jgi:acyl-homoserine lactone acylase PvdQ
VLSRKLAVLAAALSAAALLPAAASAKDYASVATDIVPSGQYGSVPAPPQATVQAKMYDALTPLFSHVTQADVVADFKPAPLGSGDAPRPVTTEAVPHAGVTISRDAYDVPYVRGVTRDDVTWGAGWVIAEDRGLLLEQARNDSMVAAIDAPGVSAFGLITSLQSFTPSAQTLAAVNPDGRPAVSRASRPGGAA